MSPWPQNWLFEVLLLKNLSLVQSTAPALIEYNHQKRSLLSQAILSGKEIRRHSINGTGKGFLENYITVSHACLVYLQCIQLAMQYYIATAVQAYTILLQVYNRYVSCTDSA